MMDMNADFSNDASLLLDALIQFGIIVLALALLYVFVEFVKKDHD